MATRSRTALFMRFREDARKLGNGPGGISRPHSGLSDRELDDFGHKPEFVTLHDQLGRQMGIVDRRLTRLADLQAKRLLPGFAEEDLLDQDRQIKAESDVITKEIHACEVAVRRIPSGGDNSVWNSMQKTFALELQNLSMRFRGQQKQYLTSLERQRDLINSALIKKSEGQLVLLEDEAGADGVAAGFTQDQMMEVQAVDFHLDERNREIERISASIQDIATVMKDMSQLVVEQGTILDRIDYNIEESQYRTGEATKELAQAERYQRRSFSFAIVMCLLVGCFIMALALIIKILS